MFTTGFAIFLGLVFIFIKLPRRTMLRWLRYDVVLDVAATLIVLAIHFGTIKRGPQPVSAESAPGRLFGEIWRSRMELD